jgi:uncharacterized membrane protein YqjE
MRLASDLALFLLSTVNMDVLREYGGTAQSARPNIHSLAGSAKAWIESFLQLALMEGKQAAFALALIVGFGIGAAILLICGWLALIACGVAALVDSGLLGWTWSLLLAALLSFAGAGGLGFLAYKRTRVAMFEATRRQLGLNSASASPKPRA